MVDLNGWPAVPQGIFLHFEMLCSLQDFYGTESQIKLLPINDGGALDLRAVLAGENLSIINKTFDLIRFHFLS